MSVLTTYEEEEGKKYSHNSSFARLYRGAKRGNYRIRQCPPIWHLIINKPHFSFPHLGKGGSVSKKKKLDGTFRLRDKILNAREFKEATMELGPTLLP